MKLFKTEIVIWTEWNPVVHEEDTVIRLAEESRDGNAYCSKVAIIFVDPEEDPDWDGSAFFEKPNEEEDE